MAQTRANRLVTTSPVEPVPPAPAAAAAEEGPQTWWDKHGFVVIAAIAVGLLALIIAFNMN